jgi:hypothetical protein
MHPGLEHGPQAHAKPGEMRRQQNRVRYQGFRSVGACPCHDIRPV